MSNHKTVAVWALTLCLTAGMGGVASASTQTASQPLCPTSGLCYFHYIEKDYKTGDETKRYVNHPEPGLCYPMDRAVAGQNWTNKTIILSQTTCEDGYSYDAQVASHSSWRDENTPYRAFVTPYDYQSVGSASGK
ncbi:hypothetical protein ACGFY6_29635 [Streptomyces sp. NPDC048387]|uniref:hypothetical protein n=1 Tax=unclassified Streptomyces TaxID=2593676 RepID=UPI0033A29F41